MYIRKQNQPNRLKQQTFFFIAISSTIAIEVTVHTLSWCFVNDDNAVIRI